MSDWFKDEMEAFIIQCIHDGLTDEQIEEGVNIAMADHATRYPCVAEWTGSRYEMVGA